MIGFPWIDLGGIARVAKITARAAVKGGAGPQAGRAKRDP